MNLSECIRASIVSSFDIEVQQSSLLRELGVSEKLFKSFANLRATSKFYELRVYVGHVVYSAMHGLARSRIVKGGAWL